MTVKNWETAVLLFLQQSRENAGAKQGALNGFTFHPPQTPPTNTLFIIHYKRATRAVHWCSVVNRIDSDIISEVNTKTFAYKLAF